VLQGVNAQVTQANVNDLDEWQAAEGGSTNNTAAFNPFNTRRMTDVSGAPLPAVDSANGFPAFATWTAGCAATVATLFQPNMWSITSALRAGNVAPAGAYLATVDQSAWCAASADGVPCYASTILGAAGAIPALLTRSSALDVFGNVKSDLRSYQIDVAAATSDQSALTTRQQGLAAAEIHLSSAQAHYDAASRALRHFAIEEYVNNGLYATDSIANLGSGVKASAPQDADGVVAQQYLSIAASNLMARAQSAEVAVKASIAGRDAATRAVTLATVALASADAAERQSLTQMVADMATMQIAGACTTVSITAPTNSVPAAGTPATTGPTTTVPSTTVPSTTLPTTTTTTTTTTTLPPTATTTTTLPTTTTTTVPSTTVPTTTVPSTTTTTTTPSTTTTTTAPGTPSTASPQTAIPAGVASLQGCVAALAPSISS
jgi:hypothetical protein